MDVTGGEVVIYRSSARSRCDERALVLRAMGIEHRVRHRAGEWTLEVPGDRVERAVRELDQYARENRDWPRPRPGLPQHPLALTGAAAYVVVLLSVAAADGKLAFNRDWFAAGRLETGLVRQGAWWRTVTALTLHLDVGHLAGNALLGSVFGLVAGRLFGQGLTWLSIVLAGAVGNAASALIQPAPHAAVGASTAVFAALGLIAAYGWRRRVRLRLRRAVRWAPLVVAMVLLVWTGSGSGRTDVVAHLTGFLSGIGLGACFGSLSPDIAPGPRIQRLLGLGALLLVAGAWAIALRASG